MNSESRSLETLAIAGHGGAVVVHSLAATWHFTQDRRIGPYGALHIGLALFSLISIYVHAKRVKGAAS